MSLLAHLAVWALFLLTATGTVAGFVLWFLFVALDAATLMMGR